MSVYTRERLFLTDSSMLRTTMPTCSRELLDAALDGLAEAHMLTDDDDLAFALAHRCALRVAAAVIAASTTVGLHAASTATTTKTASASFATARRRRSRPQNAWVLLVRHSPQLREWADFFSANAPRRAAAEAGTAHVTSRMAQDMSREVLRFMADAVAVITAMTAGSIARAG